MITDFDLVAERSGAAALLRVRGELDLVSAPRLRGQLLSLVDEGVRDSTVDLADLEFIDPSGLRALVSALRLLRDNGGDVALRSPRPGTMKVLEITGLTSVFTLV